MEARSEKNNHRCNYCRRKRRRPRSSWMIALTAVAIIAASAQVAAVDYLNKEHEDEGGGDISRSSLRSSAAAADKDGALENNNDQTTSSSTAAKMRAITVNCATPYTNHNYGHVFQSGDIVSHNDRNYQCTRPRRCSNDSFAPGISESWGMAWSMLEECIPNQQANNIHEKENEYEMMYTETSSIRMITSPPTPTPRPSPRLRTSKAAAGVGRASSPTAKQVEESVSMAASFVKAITMDDEEEQPEPNSSAATTEEMNTASESINTTVCVEGVLYVCTIQDWCQLSDFELNVGRYWTLIWLENGSCGDVDGEEAEDVVEEEEETAEGGIESVNADESPSSDPPCPEETWVAGKGYSDGDKITSLGHSYICKEYPYSLWCGMRGYEPGVDQHWEMAWNLERTCPGFVPDGPVTSKPTFKPAAPIAPASIEIVKAPRTTKQVYDTLEQKKSRINSELFLYDTGTADGYVESTVYRYRGFKDGLKVMHEEGVGDSFFYLGDDSDIGYHVGLVNIAAFLAQSMKETIKYDVCDENSWDLVNARYPLSNACGQLGQSYQDYHCPEHEKHMECEVDPNMKITATTHAKWYGAPAPLFCAPKSDVPFTGFWDYGMQCNNPWANPPEYCEVYEGQKAGGFDNSSPVKNTAGRTDVEGCCWWGRGVIQTTGVCNFGKLNYFLGARAKKEGRPSRYPSIDFCKTPDAVCASKEHQELKWVAGYFYWINSLQAYRSEGWDYIAELHNFVRNGMEGDAFINAVSGIVNRGCHNPPCGTGLVDGGAERSANFREVLSVFFD